MTNQRPDKLVNLHPRLDFGDLALYFVLRGDFEEGDFKSQGNAFVVPKEPDAKIYSTGLKRGYVATFQLNPDGTLQITQFKFLNDLHEGREMWNTRQAEQQLEGNFWMEMRTGFWGSCTYIPFRNGRIVENREEWRFEAGLFPGSSSF